jgi:ribosome-associated protein YbcJ (S4-like RNA binding protein)
MGRWRLRFLLREVDLRSSVTTIGRDEECEIVFDDTLVSRRHARIFLAEHGALIEDLDSRNGVFVNGEQIERSRQLLDGDRVRIGTQDFVFCEAHGGAKGRSDTTGVLTFCEVCGSPYVGQTISCPNCGTPASGRQVALTLDEVRSDPSSKGCT